ncbi:translation initiation factor IF-2 N-terminal domain-containing protein [Aliarcobacter cryaerophilus]|uniref:translation initiation factor IF-2 N-terminal domain-containing protein n=1 Tax=Aliarcobacter cryaerophilus TaxID=28198 RepID=UPI003DA2099B
MSDKVRVYEIAEETGASSADVLKKARDLGLDLKSPQSAVSNENAEEITKYIISGELPKIKLNNVYQKNDIKTIQINIENLKQIKKLTFKIELKKGIYSIIGNNGVGKSSLITCIGKLVETNCLREEFKGNDSYKKSQIEYIINNELNIQWVKPKNWIVSTNNSTLMPTFNGVFEASLISGHRFNHIEHKRKSIYSNQLKYSEKADSFIIDNLDYIINGSKSDKYLELYYLTNSKVKELYFIKYDSDYITEFYFSAGEYFLLSILKFIFTFKDRKNKENIGVIVIDEIELSLHPLAQKRLIQKLIEFKNDFNLLIIFATHSLHIIEELNAEEIYYFENNKGECKLTNPIYRGYLASRLYQHTKYDRIILVEDDLAKKFIEKLILDEQIDNILYEIIPIGGWEKVIEIYKINKHKKFYSDAEVLVVLDGDVNDKQKANKPSFDDVNKRFLPIDNIEKYSVIELINDNSFIKKVERHFLNYKSFNDLNIDIKTKTTEDIKLTFKKGIVEEIKKEAGKSFHTSMVEDFILKEIIEKLKNENHTKIEKFRTDILDFLK